MARALVHRGPDEEGFFYRPGVALASRRLSIVGLADGQQPVTNEDGNVIVVFNGELFDHLEKRAELEARGHRLVKHCDTEIIPHLWEEHQRGNVRAAARAVCHRAVGRTRAAPDARARPLRDLPALLDAAGRLAAVRVRDQSAAGFRHGAGAAGPARASITSSRSPRCRGRSRVSKACSCCAPGTFSKSRPAANAARDAEIADRAYWEMDFPDRGDEERGDDPRRLVDEFEQVMLRAVDKRLKADVPVGSYLSGGVDSSMIAALACHLKGPAINTYTIRVDSPELDELDAANLVARHISTKPPIVQEFRAEDAVDTYPELIQAAEAPVIDTSCAALLQLARRVHECGQKVVLTGEGADEWLVGYPWYKAAKADRVSRYPAGRAAERPGAPRLSAAEERAAISTRIPARHRGSDRRPERVDRFLRPARAVQAPLLFRVDARGARAGESVGRSADARSSAPNAGIRCNRGIWVAGRVTLAGHLLQAKGDRVAMHSSVEVRYPFLDEDVFDFPGQAAPEVEAARFPRQASAASAGRALAAGVRLPAAQGDLPRAAGQLPHGSGAAVRRPALERRIAAPHRLFRRRRGAALAACLSPDARRARCRASPWRGASPPWWRRSSGTTSTSTRTWLNCRRASAELLENLPSELLGFRIVFLRLGHREPLGDELSRVRISAHLRVGATELDVVHEAIGIERDGLLEAAHRVLVFCGRQLAISNLAPGRASRRSTSASARYQRPRTCQARSLFGSSAITLSAAILIRCEVAICCLVSSSGSNFP